MYSTPGNISQVMLKDTGKYFNARGLGNGTFWLKSLEIQKSRKEIYFLSGIETML